MPRRDHAHRLEDDPAWYRNAVIYELHVRAFCDSDGDGIGDFRGLIQKLDYLEELGVTALWLLPFYPSPLKDDGYDIADFAGVHPSYGTMRDAKRFINEAHKRGMRVITELVLNHTSDEHQWFQRARKAAPGSPERDFYVWSETDERYQDVRIIFKDFERSNWTWDHQAQAYFWHRFYSHQPDLNFDNPEVHKAVLKTLEFWLDAGVDGLRLDAVPYLYEREGTNCENLPETHEFLKKLRKRVDDRYKNRMLLAEANQWPEDAAEYFGDGDECHMAFHFPLMPRLFMAIHMEDRFPILDILQQTPAIPEPCQWAIFLRNHDELTLEMVTDEERDYMYRMYAHDQRARINLGIRRRLAPLLGNNRRKIELMNGLLFSLPGTPVIYYGDEIGMGDNIYLGDRNAVRTPMQWSPDRNAGFSRANPQQLYLPVIIDPEYHYETVNVEAQQANPHSLLWWMRRLITLRQRSPVFGTGRIEFLHPDNPKVIAFLREDDSESVLVVANLSRFVQCVELDLATHRGRQPVEMFGRTRFPLIGELPYFLTLGPHSFYWFSLEPVAERAEIETGSAEPPTLTVAGGWEEALDRRSKRGVESAIGRSLQHRRWFGGKARTVQSTRVIDSMEVPLGGDGERAARLALVEVEYTEGESEVYSVPLAYASGKHAEDLLVDPRRPVVANVMHRGDGQRGVIYDASFEPDVWTGVLETIARRRRLRGGRAELVGARLCPANQMRGQDGEPLRPTLSGEEQSNTSALFDEKFMIKMYRRVSEGENPELEIGRFLTERAKFPHSPDVVGWLEWRRDKQQPRTLALAQRYVWNEGSAWRQALTALSSYFEHASTVSTPLPPEPADGPMRLVDQQPPDAAYEAIGSYLQSAELLGRRTGELHAALASEPNDPVFAPEPFAAPHYQRSLYQSMRNLTRRSLRLLRRALNDLPEPVAGEARALLGGESRMLEVFSAVKDARIAGRRIRTHGDYHLGQVLHTGKDYVIIDFEGEPARPIGERRLKRSPLTDVAGMLRSFDYAAYTALDQHVERWGVETNDELVDRLRSFGRSWRRWVSAAFLQSYLATVSEAALLPDDPEQLEVLLRTFLLEKAMYELGYELNNRPAWARIPLRGLLDLSDQEVQA